MQREFFSIQEAQVAVLVPPPISGLGASGGFQMMLEDRSSLGLAELQKAALEVMRAGSGQTGLRASPPPSAPAVPSFIWISTGPRRSPWNIPLNNVFDTLQAYLGSSYVNLFNKFNQSYQVYVQAAAPYRLSPRISRALYVRNHKGEMVPLGTLMKINRTLGSELVTRYNLYPAALHIRVGGPGLQLGRGPEPHGTGGQKQLAPGHLL